MCFCQITWSVVDFRFFFDDVISGGLVFMLGRAGLVPILPKLGPRPPETTRAVKWVTWYKMRPSDWSIQKMLQSDWLVRIPPPYTTLRVRYHTVKQSLNFREEHHKTITLPTPVPFLCVKTHMHGMP